MRDETFGAAAGISLPGIRIDAVILYYLSVVKEGSSMSAFLIEVEKKKQYTAGESGVEWRLDCLRVTNRVTRKVIMEYVSENL